MHYTVQITHNLNGTLMCKSKKHVWHQTTRVQVCKINNAPHTRTYPNEVSATKQSSLQPVASALSFIIYPCRTILDGIVTDILGHPRHTAFVAPCS